VDRRDQISPREAQVLQHILAGEGTAATEARSRGQIVARILGFL